MPNPNQVSDGLQNEAAVQMQLAMGHVKNQLLVLEAINNIKLTWKKKLELAGNIN